MRSVVGGSSPFSTRLSIPFFTSASFSGGRGSAGSRRWLAESSVVGLTVLRERTFPRGVDLPTVRALCAGRRGSAGTPGAGASEASGREPM